MAKACVFSLICLIAAPSLAVSQADGAGPARRVALSLHLGGAVGGPASGIADDLRQAGYDDPSPCFFFCNGTSTIDHPSEHQPMFVGGATVRYMLKDNFLVGGWIEIVDIGGAHGYDGKTHDYVFSLWTATVSSVSVYWTESGLRLGGGPGLYRLSDDDTDGEHELTRFGLIGEVGLEVPSNRRFFLDLTARANVVPSTDVEYDVPGGSVVTLHPNWTHVQLLVGFGIHL